MTTETISTSRSLFSSVGAAIADAYVGFIKRAPAAKCAEEAQRLFALTDEELARLGLTRDGVLPYAFRHHVHY